MAIQGLAYSERNEYICREDTAKTAEDGATVFEWSALPNWLITRISDQQSSASVSFGDNSTQTFVTRTQFRNRECFRFGVKEIENMLIPGKGKGAKPTKLKFKLERGIENGRDIEFVSEETLNHIPQSTINEVGAHIFQSQTMTEGQRKNFEALSSLLGASDPSNAPTATTTTNEDEDATDQQSDQTAKTAQAIGQTQSTEVPPGAVLEDQS